MQILTAFIELVHQRLAEALDLVRPTRKRGVRDDDVDVVALRFPSSIPTYPGRQ